jgi:hypothetical protein
MSEDSGPDFHAEVRDDLVGLRGRGFGVEFRRVGDRWIDAGTGPVAAIELVRPQLLNGGGEDPARVPHPVYQELQLHGPTSGSSLCLLLTGLSFNHHFSAAVTLSMDPDLPGGILLDFDVADRCRSPVESLAATYLVGLDSGALGAADPGRIAWDVATPSPGRLELVAGPQASLALAEAGRKATRVQVVASIQPGTFTHRLRYGWRWTSADGPSR